MRSSWKSIHAAALAGAYFYPDKTPDLIEVFLIIKSGPDDEGEGPEGLAHYLEHLVWLSAVNPDGRATTARHDGARMTEELTIYSLKGPPDELDGYLATMAKVFQTPSLDEPFMLEERDIVQREYDYRVVESRTYPIARKLITSLFGDAPIARSVMGTPESISKMTPKAALELHAHTHVPANAVLFVIGNSELKTTARLVDKHLGGVPAGQPLPRPLPPPFQERREVIETSVEGASLEQIIYLKRVKLEAPITRDELGRQLDLLHAILDSTLEGGLAKPLRYDNFIARRYALDLKPIAADDVLMTFEAAPDEGVALSDLLTAFEATLETIAEKTIPEATFQRIMKKRLSALESVQGKRRPAIRLIMTQTAYDAEPIDPKTEIERYGQTTLDDVNALVRALAGTGDVAAALVSSDSPD